jgi:hypothetical protein
MRRAEEMAKIFQARVEDECVPILAQFDTAIENWRPAKTGPGGYNEIPVPVSLEQPVSVEVQRHLIKVCNDKGWRLAIWNSRQHFELTKL